MARVNVKSKFEVPKTAEGAPAKRINPVQQLRRLVLPCLLWEDNFYVDGMTIAEQIAEAVKSTPGNIAAQIAIEARERFHLRHVPLLVVREMARLHSGSSLVSDTLARVIQRPDELGEFLAIYQKDGKDQPLSAQVKKGLARAFGKFDQYQLAKYAQGGAVRLRDVMFLTHPKPSTEMAPVWRQLAANELGAADARSKFGGTGPDPVVTTGTWESDLSATKGENKGETWTRKLQSGSLGYLALLRNLRNMLEAGVDPGLISNTIIQRKGSARVLPFRYVAAARVVPQLEPAIDAALCASINEMRPLPGLTFVLVDVSGSMDHSLSAKSDLTRIDAAAALAAIIPGNVRVFSFSQHLVEVPPRRGMAGVDAIKRSQPHQGTYLGQAVASLNASRAGADRLIVISDEQSHDVVPDPVFPHSYLINVASNKNGVGYGKFVHVDGFSESVLRFIMEYENLDVDYGDDDD
jgi:60 kDa SS-A/Ro ribonucleoprotein